MRVVADTNVLVRALINGVDSSPLLQLWQVSQVQLVVSTETLAELAAVLTRPKFQRYFTADNVTALLTLLREHGEWVVINSHMALCRDPKDDIFLNLAIAAQADYVVSEDNDLVADAALIATMLTDYQIQIAREAELVKALAS
ncbi:MAG TPA: putative toxin-antitoxin system toxin component, PIN family [Anaerolineae bacterium]|nr:putative toxin-antitoxin system toxin component, PIN family [Anaerolineae bacterium]